MPSMGKELDIDSEFINPSWHTGITDGHMLTYKYILDRRPQLYYLGHCPVCPFSW